MRNQRLLKSFLQKTEWLCNNMLTSGTGYPVSVPFGKGLNENCHLSNFRQIPLKVTASPAVGIKTGRPLRDGSQGRP